MPEPQEVDGWICEDPPNDLECVAEWHDCEECSGKGRWHCKLCGGCGGGYYCWTHDTNAEPPKEEGGPIWHRDAVTMSLHQSE